VRGELSHLDDAVAVLIDHALTEDLPAFFTIDAYARYLAGADT
jgi:hypothetical protein